MLDEQRRDNLRDGEQKEVSGVLKMAFSRIESLSLVSDPLDGLLEETKPKSGQRS